MCEKKVPTTEDDDVPLSPDDNNIIIEDDDLMETDHDDDDDEDDDDDDDLSGDPDEFHVLDVQLDALNSALDEIEEKNNDLQNQLLELLENNKVIRKELQDLKKYYPDATTPTAPSPQP